MVRPPAVAGAFYPADARELTLQVDEFCARQNETPKIRAIACIVPHAGYTYSGHVAGAVYAQLEIPERCILVGPRHFPQGHPLAILTEGSWRTPLGDAEIDAKLAADLAHADPLLREDNVAHAREHSLEVQIPFLQRLARQDARGFRFAPVVLASDRYPVLEELGRALAQTVVKADAAQSGPVLIIASTDMNHYESDAATRVKDARAIERILALDARGLYDTVRNEGITMCGY
ncbi:MAG TPA: AmmeMemoRadiSam system protein B, partial [Candidatus Acidoferrales bacterium]|nr:AmmeMemoRadiSam system protein B [Candidatus Acidoferrales bacterium]